MPHLVDNLVVFARMLRAAGLPVGTERVLTLIDALHVIDLGSPGDVRSACRTILVQRHEELALFDTVFDEFLRSGMHADRGLSPGRPQDFDQVTPGEETPGPDDPHTQEHDEQVIGLQASSHVDAIATKDFAELTEQELRIARAALARLTWDHDARRTRRWIPGRGRRIDLRRAIARSLRTGGEITMIPRRRQRTRPRPIVLLCDVSGSMEPYTRTLLLFAHTLARGRRGNVEAFLFATRLTRIT